MSERPTRASMQPGRKLIITSAEGTRMKGLRAIPAERRDAAVAAMLAAASHADKLAGDDTPAPPLSKQDAIEAIRAELGRVSA